MRIEQVRAIRIANGIKQYDFAELIGIPIGTWSNVERERQPFYGERKANAIRVLKELGCDFSVLNEMEYQKRTGLPVHTVEPIDEETLKEALVFKEWTPNVFADEMRHIEIASDKLVVKGVGKDEPVVVNKKGGGQSKVEYRFDLLDAKAMFAMTRVLQEGAEKYGADNWRLIDVNDHINHLIIHLYAYLAKDTSDEHLAHALCRAMFALGVEIENE